ncbi:MAG: adenylate/guanylate cyclase domain-containing protein [Acidimicrobiia bacterium]
MNAAAQPKTLPSGLVTFVLTDIEGSTRLFRELGDAYPSLLADHYELLRAAVAGHRGVEVGTEGDSLLIAFPDAAEAIAACLEGQLALSAHRWPPGAEIQVRMGLHTGEATPVDGNYVALPLHQVARIAAGAHGGQILVSQATATAVEGRLPAEVRLAALGSFQLRGFPTPEPLYQLRHPDLREDFPPLRAIGILAHNLPFRRASFVGRAQDRETLARTLGTKTGLVTVVGPGGVGKTRLAVQVAFDVLDEFADGVWLVELAPLTDPASVPRAVASAVGIAEVPGQSTEEVLASALGSKAVLLILDNCEHLLDAVAGLAQMLSERCPHLVILSTSREPLDIDGEVVWRVEPLLTLDPDQTVGVAELKASDAVQLFTERAAAVRSGFELTDDNAGDVARIVFHLSGMPLAIELAAAALAERSLSGVLSGLEDRFSLLIRGRRTAPTRHQTLRAAIEWSLDLLEPSERILFDRLSVFAGSGTTAAAAEVCGGGEMETSEVPDLMGRLVRASLVSIEPESPDRWTMLESIRELGALELAEGGGTEEFSRRHRTWAVGRVEAVEDRIGRKGQAAVIAEMAHERDNIRRAIESAVSAEDAEIGLRICVAMTRYWTSNGDWTEGSEQLDNVLALSGGDRWLRGRAIVALGSLLLLRGELEEADKCFGEARALAAAAGDDVNAARALLYAGYVAFRHSHLTEAKACWEEALTRAQSAGDQRVAASVLRSLAIVAGTEGRQDRAGELLDQAIGLAQESGDDQLLRLLLGSSAEMNIWLGRYQVAEKAYGDALTLAAEIGDFSARPLLLAELGWVAILRGDPLTAQRLSIESAELAEDLGTPRVLAHALRLGGEALMRLGDLAGASETLDRALTVTESMNAPAEVAGVRCSQACLALEIQEWDRARVHAGEAIDTSGLAHAMRRTTPQWVLGMVSLLEGDLGSAGGQFLDGLSAAEERGAPRHEATFTLGLAAVRAAEGRTGEAASLGKRALDLWRNLGDRLGVIDCLVVLAGLATGSEPEEAAELLGAAGSLRDRAGAEATPREAAQVAAISGSLSQALAAVGREAGTKMNVTDAIAAADRIISRIEAVGAGDEDPNQVADPGNQ